MPRIRRWLIRLVFGLTGLLAVLILMIGAGLAVLATDMGRERAGRALLGAINDPAGITVQVGRFGGVWPFEIVLEDVRVSDPSGDWALAERAALTLDPWALVSATVHVRDLTLTGADLARLPDLPASEAPPEDPEPLQMPRLPDLPVAVVVDAVRIDAARIGAPVAGTPVTLDAAARGRWIDSGIILIADLAETGAAGLGARIRFERDHATDGVAVDITAQDRAGGVLAGLIGQPDLGAVSLTAHGEGTGRAFESRLTVDADAFGRVEGRADGGWTDGRDLAVGIEVRPGAAWPADAAAMAGERIVLTSRVGFPDAPKGHLALALEDLVLASDALRLTGDMRVDPDRQAAGGARIAARIDAGLTEVLTLTGTQTAIGLDDGTVSLDLAGPLATPALTLRLTAEGLRADPAAVDAVALTARVSLDDPATSIAMITVDGAVQGLEPGLDGIAWPYGRQARLEARARFDQAAQTVDLEASSLTAEGLRLTADGQWDLSTMAGRIAAAFSAERLAAFAPDLLRSARLEGRTVLSQAPGGQPQVDLTAAMRSLAFIDEALSDAVGGTVTASAQASLDPDGTIRVPAFDLSTGSGLARLSGSGSLVESGLMADIALAADDLTGFSTLTGLDLSGSLTGEARVRQGEGGALTVAADLQAPALGLNRLALRDMVLNARLMPEADDQRAAVSLSFQDERLQGAGAQTLDLAAVLGPAGTVSIDRFKGRMWGVSFDREAETGTLSLNAPSLAPLGAAVRRVAGPGLPVPVSGSLTGRAEIGAAQRAEIKLRNLTLADPGADPILLSRVTVSANRSAGGDLEATLTGEDLAAADLTIRKLTAFARGSVTALAFGLEAKAPGEDGLRLTAEGTYEGGTDDPGAGARLQLGTLDLAAKGLTVSQPDPLILDLGGAGITIEDWRLAIADAQTGTSGTLAMSAATHTDGLEASVEFGGPPVSVLSLAAGAPRLSGALDGTVQVSTRRGGRGARIDVAMAGLGASQGLSGQLDIDGSWDGAQATLVSELRAGETVPVRMRIALPFALPENGGSMLPDTAPLDGRIEASGPIGPLWPYLPLPEHRLRGQGDADLRIGGTLGAPTINGRIAVTDGRYESLVNGTRLRKIALEILATGRGGTFSLAATDGDGGSLSGQGRLGFERDGIVLETGVDLKNMILARRDDLIAQASGDIRVAGDTGDGLDVTGTIKLKTVDIRIPDQLPPTVVDLETRTLSGAILPAERAEAEDDEAARESVLPVRLAITIEADKTITVRGRGLESRWSADLAVRGTAGDPRIAGRAFLDRGELDFISRVFDLTQGEITFDGGRTIDPRLDIEAQQTAGEITAIVIIRGPASKPDITLDSIPSLPRDAVLSQVLFGKNVAELSTFEVVQLAQVVATLSGGGSGLDLMGRARDTLGLDVLKVDVDPTASDPAQSVSVTAGKYVSEDVYVGVKQGTQPGSSAVTLEVQVTDHLLLHTDVAQTAGSTVGLRWQWDY